MGQKQDRDFVKKFHYILDKSEDGQFYFVLRSSNNKVLMTSETYKTHRAALKAINAIQNAYFLHQILDLQDRT